MEPEDVISSASRWLDSRQVVPVGIEDCVQHASHVKRGAEIRQPVQQSADSVIRAIEIDEGINEQNEQSAPRKTGAGENGFRHVVVNGATKNLVLPTRLNARK